MLRAAWKREPHASKASLEVVHENHYIFVTPSFSRIRRRTYIILGYPIKSIPGDIPLPLQVGDTAPDFSLTAATGTERHTFKLSDHRGKKNVVLAFYALDWSPT